MPETIPNPHASQLRLATHPLRPNSIHIMHPPQITRRIHHHSRQPHFSALPLVFLLLLHVFERSSGVVRAASFDGLGLGEEGGVVLDGVVFLEPGGAGCVGPFDAFEVALCPVVASDLFDDLGCGWAG